MVANADEGGHPSAPNPQRHHPDENSLPDSSGKASPCIIWQHMSWYIDSEEDARWCVETRRLRSWYWLVHIKKG
jgi:hypothetical protein